MKKLSLLLGLLVVSVLASQSAFAGVKVRAGISSTSYDLGGNYIKSKSSFKPVNFGVTYGLDGGVYVDLAMSSGSGNHDGWGGVGSPTQPFKRSDWAMVVGKGNSNTGSGISTAFYVGYKSGTTTLGAPKPPMPWSEETLTTSGAIFGGGVSYPISEGMAGTVGANFGLGLMGATWKDNNGFNVKSKTATGLSFGLSYSYPITSTFGVVADYKYNSYKYTFDGLSPFIVEEKTSALGATAYMNF